MCSAFLPALSASNDDDDHLYEKSKSTFQLFNIATEHLICEEKEGGGQGGSVRLRLHDTHEHRIDVIIKRDWREVLHCTIGKAMKIKKKKFSKGKQVIPY